MRPGDGRFGTEAPHARAGTSPGGRVHSLRCNGDCDGTPCWLTCDEALPHHMPARMYTRPLGCASQRAGAAVGVGLLLVVKLACGERTRAGTAAAINLKYSCNMEDIIQLPLCYMTADGHHLCQCAQPALSLPGAGVLVVCVNLAQLSECVVLVEQRADVTHSAGPVELEPAIAVDEVHAV